VITNELAQMSAIMQDQSRSTAYILLLKTCS